MPYETLLIGLVLALLYAEATGISPGGLIVPGYVALYLDQPSRVLGTLAAAALAVLAFRAAGRFLLIFGRRRFVFMILVGAVIAQTWSLVLPTLFPGPLDLRVIGWVVPGILASSLERQKAGPTLASLAVVSVLTYLLVRAIA